MNTSGNNNSGQTFWGRSFYSWCYLNNSMRLWRELDGVGVAQQLKSLLLHFLLRIFMIHKQIITNNK